jgi:hypothetical protein
MRHWKGIALLAASWGAAVVAIFVGVPQASASSEGLGPIKLCTYTAGNLTPNSETYIVKIVVFGGKGKKGTLRWSGAGNDHLVRFTLKKGGIALVPVEVQQSGAVTLSARLGTTPAKTRIKHVSVTYSGTNAVTQRGCTAS